MVNFGAPKVEVRVDGSAGGPKGTDRDFMQKKICQPIQYKHEWQYYC